MIDEARTLELFGYTSDELSKGSHKKVVAVCEDCGKYRMVEKKQYRDLCKSCVGKYRSEDSRKKVSERMLGKTAWNKGLKDSNETRKRKSRVLMGNCRSKGCTQNLSPEVRYKRSESMIGNKHNEGKKASDETKEKMSKSRLGKKCSDETRHKISLNHARHWKDKSPSEETRMKLSAAGQRIPYDEWEGFAKEQLYCPKFNDACRESNREKYDRRCFLSDVTEADNGQKLSVHHIDMNKAQGCDGHTWKLVPLSKKWHARSHSMIWKARIAYLLEHVWR